MNCRHCNDQLKHVFLDLGFAPPSNAYLSREQLTQPETSFPLKLFVCSNCWLVQTEDYAEADALFAPDYAYFSSTSKSWLEHAENYARTISAKLSLGKDSLVIEIASNDGYLLKNFVSSGVPCLGIEPTKSTADAAEALGIPVLREFFGVDCAKRLAQNAKKADLICGNNVYAHVPDINDFTKGMQIALKDSGTINLEFPHLLQLIANNQFDTAYHEHFSYLSLIAVTSIFSQAGLRIFDVEKLTTHGGSLRVYGCHENDPRTTSEKVSSMLAAEESFGLRELNTYLSFQAKANRVKDDFVSFLIDQKRNGKSVMGYGAAAKGNTLMNFAGVRPDLVPFVCDAAPSKQGKFLPASHIPIVPPSEIEAQKPDWIVIFPWNIADEVTKQLSSVNAWGGKFVIAVPELRFLS
jgi:C-methyltransferase C-terminal domain/Putative zinc binding domain/Methyltransferase domain